MNDEIEARLVELETKASFQEAALQDMSGVIAAQNISIEKLETALRDLRDKMKELSGEGQPPLPENERPPHY